MRGESTGGTEGLLAGRRVLVAGGTGNVGRHIVRALLARGATVIVPSRSPAKLERLRATSGAGGGRLVTVVGNVADERDAVRVRDDVTQQGRTPPDAVVASLGAWTSASVLDATRADLVQVLDDYVVAHFVVARTFIPALAIGGSYILINGPSAFGTWPGSALVSTATAAQAMLARALFDDPEVRRRVRVTDLVIHPSARIGPEETSDGPLGGPAVGRFVVGIMLGRVDGGPTLHLESPEQLAELP